MRVGPSRLISTAESSGESNDTAAAEWITTSHEASTARSASFEPEPVGADVAGDRRDPPRRHLVERLGTLCALGAQAVEGVVLQQLALHTPGGRRAPAVADEQDELAVGHAAQQPLDERRADEPGGSRDGDPLARERLGDHGPNV